MIEALIALGIVVCLTWIASLIWLVLRLGTDALLERQVEKEDGMLPEVTIYRDRKGEWRWRLQSSSDFTAESGEGYTTKADARRAFNAVRLRLPLARVRMIEPVE